MAKFQRTQFAQITCFFLFECFLFVRVVYKWGRGIVAVCVFQVFDVGVGVTAHFFIGGGVGVGVWGFGFFVIVVRHGEGGFWGVYEWFGFGG